jgi:hypothetical protein
MSVRTALNKYERATSDGFLLSNVIAARVPVALAANAASLHAFIG